VLHPDNKHLVYPLGATVAIVSVDRDRTQTFLRGHTGAVTAVAVSRSGRLIASGQTQCPSLAAAEIIVWDWETMTPVHRLAMHKHGVAAMGFSATDRYLVSLGAEADNHVIVWDLEEGKIVCGGPAHKEPASCLDCLNTDELRFVTAGREHVRVWSFQPGAKRVVPEDVSMGSVRRNATCVSVDSDDGRAYVGTTTGDVLEVDVAHKVFKSLGPVDRKGVSAIQGGVESLAIVGKGRLLCGSGTGHVYAVVAPPGEWSIKGKAELDSSAAAVTSVAPMSLGDHAFCGSASGRVFALETDTLTAKVRSTAPVAPVVGAAFAFEYKELFVTCYANVISVRNARTGAELLRIEEEDKTLSCACVHVPRDGKSIVSGWSDGAIRAYTPQTGQALFKIDHAHHGGVTALTSSVKPYYRLLSGGADGQLRAWKIGKESHVLDVSVKEHKGSITGICMTADETRAVTSSADGSAVTWDLVRMAALKILFCNATVRGAAWGTDDAEVVCVGQERKIVFFEAASGRRVREIDAGIALTAVAVPQGCSHIVTAAQDATISVWDYASGKLVGVANAHSTTALVIAIAPGNEYFISCCDNGAIYSWVFHFSKP
jgi:WD40 repeat protein